MTRTINGIVWTRGEYGKWTSALGTVFVQGMYTEVKPMGRKGWLEHTKGRDEHAMLIDLTPRMYRNVTAR